MENIKTIDLREIYRRSSVTRLLRCETCSLKAARDCFSMPRLRNSNETDTVKGTDADDKKSPSLSSTIDEANHEACHDLMKTGQTFPRNNIAATLG